MVNYSLVNITGNNIYLKKARFIMIQELLNRHSPIPALRFKRYFESYNNRVRIFGLCEVTGKYFEINVPVEGFFVYLQGFKTITEALTSASPEEREFILTGISPEGSRGLM
jgi:hypothetical protein